MLNFLLRKCQPPKPQYRIQTSGIEDWFDGFIVQKYEERCYPSGATIYCWKDIARFESLEDAKAFLSRGERKVVS